MAKSSKKSLENQAKKKSQKEKEQILQGTVNVIPSYEYCAKAIYTCVGLGQFDGNYYVKKATHTINDGNSEVTLELIGTDVVNAGTTKGKKAENKTEETRRQPVKQNTAQDELYVGVNKNDGSVAFNG